MSNQNKLFTAGFTLIELLVVIAIIGILASVVLASLNSAREKGADAAIKQNLNSLRTQMALYYDDNPATKWGGTDSGRCGGKGGVFIHPPVKAMIDAATKQTTEPETGNNTTRCAAGAHHQPNEGSQGSYAVAVKLRAVEGWYCVDSSGAAKTILGASIPDLRPTPGTYAHCP